MNKQTIIKVSNVSFSYGNRLVLEDINMCINEGDFLGIVGPNGSGKSTLLKIILGLLQADSGSVELYGKPNSKWQQRNRIGYISQKANSFNMGFPATVYEVVSMGLTGKKGLFKRFTKEDKEIILDTIELVDLMDYKNQLIGALSGGQQQRVFIAKALVGNPELLVLDEPTVGVDTKSMNSFYKLLEVLHCIHKKTIILVSHDIGAITTCVNRVACLNRKIYFHGDNQEFIKNQEAIMTKAYQHAVHIMEHGH
ncbi:metal ABC transporter ATP-binding protein [Desulfuribacillus alkaliarsenatis]|uniref:Zinc ABC transporter ATP-binding protein n=1 Tax=Desulfuribacillus alkaliarsenatis TaxID=766136 RepID=A0A1E5G1J0_9FIRM|nr:metal ABC transporter ATP-binding protein [Desulfuribacillus alkaliarsenatis]OEF96733.1 zinc ABC transporter ATP-binding protein [Desulfuribacillus alkaliarsenatis]